MLGLDDNYVTGRPTIRHGGIAERELGQPVQTGADARIMSGGINVEPEHGVTFLESLREATGMEEWSFAAKTPRPVPANPFGGGAGTGTSPVPAPTAP
jgi:hypothetical protein